MNYLGHLLLTYPDQELTMGNLLGDMLRRVQIEQLSEGLQRGYEVHHFIDTFTDQHPGIRALVELLRTVHGKYAPVVVDVLLDHVLAMQWHKHAEISYATFTEWVYGEMVPEQLPIVLHPVAQRIRSMAAHRWLDGYPTITGMRYVLARMDRRTAFPSNFISALDHYYAHQEQFDSIFNPFYFELKQRVTDRFLDQVSETQ